MKKVAWTIVFLVILNISLFVLYGTVFSSDDEQPIIPGEEVVDLQGEEVNSAPPYIS
ncbi:hypothetical protein [Salimicrobium halophilum]|uniref:Uncharacterized protein n=1 Tax=Salimicrobium halophilum TaxID=86666 RepID=A0A1G8R5F7_9BACI|nr:hypothetical protein [Salimicrobium halophilum]SDJ11640.1 hypothetical protein SAMN04490247_0805 [Salimicrobium halophilum]